MSVQPPLRDVLPHDLRVNPMVTHAAVSHLLSAAECEQVLAECAVHPWEADLPRSSRSAKRAKREQAVPSGPDGWLGRRVASRIAELNEAIWGFALVGLEDPLRMFEYEGHDGGYISPHSDLSDRRPTRKLTFSLLVSSPDEFEGGDLDLLSSSTEGGRVQGSLTVFPSFLLHQVTPVRSGRRVTIVGWALGPTFA